MSKLSFRARQLDASKLMPIFKSEEIPDLQELSAINRAVPQMPTGMEKEEETEHHLQRALSAQQVYGTAEALVIPVPEVVEIADHYESIYGIEKSFKPPKQYVHVQAFGMDQEIPDYDMDSEDELWLNRQAKKIEVTPLKFESMMDRLEKGSGQKVVSLHEAKALLKEDDELIISVYDYWLNKRLGVEHALISQVRSEKRDGSTSSNPYVAFRRRTEKMQTRKNRKNDEVSYEKMLKLKRDLNKALTILELMKRREKSKKELLKLTIEILEKRYQNEDWSGAQLANALAQQAKPQFVPLANQNNRTTWQVSKEEAGRPRKRNRVKKPKVVREPAAVCDVDVLQPHYSSGDEESLRLPTIEPPEDPDGLFSFKRRADCSYLPALQNDHWLDIPHDNSTWGDKRKRYCLTSFAESRRCLGYTRRRLGRGGRVLLDRAHSAWDDELSRIDLISPSDSLTSPSHAQLYTAHIKSRLIPHYVGYEPSDPLVQRILGSVTPTEESGPDQSCPPEEKIKNEPPKLFDVETSSTNGSSSSQATNCQISCRVAPVSNSLLPSSSSSLSLCTAGTYKSSKLSTSSGSVDISNKLPLANHQLNNGSRSPMSLANSLPVGLSTSPSATVLQLNYPIRSSVNNSPAKKVLVSQQQDSMTVIENHEKCLNNLEEQSFLMPVT